jgi:hypothetical protein
MQPVDLHQTMLAALPRRRPPLTLDDLLRLSEAVDADTDDVARWLAWARREGHLADAGVHADRRCFRLGARRAMV